MVVDTIDIKGKFAFIYLFIFLSLFICLLNGLLRMDSSCTSYMSTRVATHLLTSEVIV